MPIAIGLVVVLASGMGLQAEGVRPQTTAELLVDLARDHALCQQGQQDRADVDRVRALLKAAVRLDPEQVDARAWLYELATLSGEREEAARMVSGLLNVAPTHYGAFARWLEAGLEAQRTVEARQAWLESIAATQRPAPSRALVHVHLAQLALEQMDPAGALEQARTALRLDGECIPAARLCAEVMPADAPPAEQLHSMLDVLRLQPRDVDAAWRAALILHDWGLPMDASVYFDHVLELRRRRVIGALPGSFLLDAARNRYVLGRWEEAVELTREVVELDPLCAAEAGIQLHYLYVRGIKRPARDTLASSYRSGLRQFASRRIIL